MRHCIETFALGVVLSLAVSMPSMAQQPSGEMTWYTTTTEPIARKVVEAFEARYPNTDVTLLRLSGAAMTTRFTSEAESGVNAADVLMSATPVVFQKHPDWFLDLAGQNLSNFDAWPEKFKHKNYIQSTFAVNIVVYNKNNVSEDRVPKTWQDLLDPRWKGRAVMIDVNAGFSYMSWASDMQKAFGDDYLQALARQDLTIATNGLGAVQAVASGAADIAFVTTANQTVDLIAQGAPIGTVTLGAPSGGNEQSAAIPSKAPHPELAKVFFNWLLSDEGQQLICAGVAASAKAGLQNCADLPSDFIAPDFGISPERAQELSGLLGLK